MLRDPLLTLSALMDDWIRSSRPASLDPGTFWFLCLSPLFAALLLAALWPARRGPRRGATATFAVLLFATIFLARFPLLCYEPFNPDESFFLSSAMRIRIDPVVYRSVDPGTSGPLNLYVTAIPQIFGAPLTYASSRLVGVFLVFGTLAFLWLTYRRFLERRLASLAILPLTCFYIFTRDPNLVHCSSEHLPVFLSAAALYLLAADYKAGAAGPWWRTAVAGVLSGAMVFAKLQALPVAAVLIGMAALLAWRKRRRVLALGALAAGAAAVPAFFLLTFLGSGALQQFWLSFYSRNAAYARGSGAPMTARLSMAAHLFRISAGPYWLGLLPLWLAGFAAAIALWYYSRERREASEPIMLLLVATTLLAVSFAAAATPGNPFPHYLLFLVAPLGAMTLAAIVSLVAAGQRWQWRWPASATVACFLLVTCCLPVLRSARTNYESVWAKARFQPEGPLVGTIRQYASARDLLVVWGWRSGLYVASQRAPGTRFADSPPQLEPSIYRDYFRRVYVADFLRARPAVFVDAVGEGGLQYTDRASCGFETVEGLREAVNRDYRQVAELDGARVFVRDDRGLNTANMVRVR